MKPDDPTGDEHKALRKAIPFQRRQARIEAGSIHNLGAVTFAIWDRMKENGENFLERCDYLVGVLKQILNKGREWKYLCEQCDDYGLMIRDCQGDRACGRHKPHLPHTFGVPCACGKGRMFEKPTKNPDDYTAAGKTAKKPPKGWSMGGR